MEDCEEIVSSNCSASFMNVLYMFYYILKLVHSNLSFPTNDTDFMSSLIGKLLHELQWVLVDMRWSASYLMHSLVNKA